MLTAVGAYGPGRHCQQPSWQVQKAGAARPVPVPVPPRRTCSPSLRGVAPVNYGGLRRCQAATCPPEGPATCINTRNLTTAARPVLLPVSFTHRPRTTTAPRAANSGLVY